MLDNFFSRLKPILHLGLSTNTDINPIKPSFLLQWTGCFIQCSILNFGYMHLTVFFFFFINITFSVFCLFSRFYFILCLPIQAKANSTHFCFCQISLQQWIQFHIIPILIVFRTVVLQTLLSGTSQCSCPRRQIFWEQKRRELFILVSLFATQTSRLLSNDCVLTESSPHSPPMSPVVTSKEDMLYTQIMKY